MKSIWRWMFGDHDRLGVNQDPLFIPVLIIILCLLLLTALAWQ